MDLKPKKRAPRRVVRDLLKALGVLLCVCIFISFFGEVKH